jgi:ubiquinone/menaquinone biosynthesis C-methylase UbiE
MKTLEETVTIAMDIKEKELLPFLPYILQDFWEIGADPDIIVYLIKKHNKEHSNHRVLDLGCGKGPVSVKIAKGFGFECLGIDAIPEFIDFAKEKANEYKVSNLCKFEVGDIREEIKNLKNFDIIILGAIGQVLGNYYETLKILDNCLHKNGLIIIDDGYIEDESCFNHPQVLKRQELLTQIEKSGMILIDEIIAREDVKVIEEYETEFVNLERRCQELIAQYPEKASIFLNYIKTQSEEYDYLKSEIIGSTMVLKRKD